MTLYWGVCQGVAPPRCQQCDDGCGTEFQFANGAKSEFIEFLGPCEDFSYDPYDTFTLFPSGPLNAACLGIPESEFIDLDWEFEWPFVAGTLTVTVTMDKAADDPAIALDASWVVAFVDPGGAAQYDYESVYSDWVEIPGAFRRFRVRVDFYGAHNINSYGCVWEGDYSTWDCRDMEASCAVYLEWETW